jgi:integrating conjugative element membrane protein (TIGR03747 family)
MTLERTPRGKPKHHKDPWDWFFAITLGIGIRFLCWLLSAIFIAVLIEWVGMMYLWGPRHSQEILHTEIQYLGSFNQNLLTGLYPSDIAGAMVDWVDKGIVFFRLREISASLASSTHNSMSVFASYGVEAFINTLFIFSVRLAVCVSALSGFALVCLVAFIDGLVERDIRRACGGTESAMIYHNTKRLVKPAIMLSFGIYMTSPFSIHPTIIFLPIMALVGISIFFAAKYFKKY